MRVLFVNQHYLPDYAATAQLLGDVAEEMASRGHLVDVLASKSIYDGRIMDLPTEEVSNGVHVHRVDQNQQRRDRLRQRAVGYLAFHAAAHLKAARLPRPDVVVPLTTPPLICLIGAWTRVIRGARFVPWIMDLYPEIAVQSGVLGRFNPVNGVWSALSRLSLRQATRVVTLSPGMKQAVVRKGVAAERIAVIPPWAEEYSNPPAPDAENPFRAAHVPAGATCVMYSGNLGTCHLWREIAGAVRLLKDDPSIYFLFIGGGKGMPLLRDEVEGLPNVKFLPYQDRADLVWSLAAGDIHLSSLDPRFDGLLLPSKLFGIMGAGRPTIHVGSAASDAARLLVANHCGLVAPPGDADALARAIAALAADPALRAAMGGASMHAMEVKFHKRILVDRLIGVLEREAARGRASGARH